MGKDSKLIVQKFGGSSLATPEQIKNIAARVKVLKDKGHQVLVVVSAMGSTTDQLSALAYQVSRAPVRRELDMLLSTGERVASSLMSLALNDIGCSAVSFTGSQAGILTDDSHTNARVIDIKPIRIETELKKGRVVVLAGFQGVSPETKEITTLGRGGTDLSAIAMAKYFGADRCEILKDVDGVFSGDPKIVTGIVSGARQIPKMNFDVLQEITFWGAKMLHHRAAELAARVQLPIFVGLAHSDGTGTLIEAAKSSKGDKMFEEMKVLSVNSHTQVFKLKLKAASHGDAYEKLENLLKKENLPWPQILDSTFAKDQCVAIVTGPIENLKAIEELATRAGAGAPLEISANNLSSVTATCAGLIASDLVGRLTRAIEGKKIRAHHILLSPMSATFVVDADQREDAIQALHSFAI